MDNSGASTAGLTERLRRVGDAVLALGHNRLRLFALEWQEERFRLLDWVAWLAAAVVVAGVGLAMVMAALALLAWQAGRLTGLMVLGAGLLVIAGILYWQLRRRLRNSPPPFAGTLAEFDKDRRWLQGKH